MRRNSRKQEKTLSDKIIMYSGIGVAILTAIVIGLLMYSKSLSDSVKDETMTLEQMAKITGNNTESNEQNTTSASTDIGKSVEDSKNELNNTTNNSAVNKENSTNKNATNNTNQNSTKSNTTNKTTPA